MIVFPGAVVGRTPDVPIEIERGADLIFDVLWWSDEERTQPVEIASAVSHVKDNDGVVILDLAPTVDGNRLMFRVLAAVTDAIEARGWGSWDVTVVAVATGETKKLAKGSVRLC